MDGTTTEHTPCDHSTLTTTQQTTTTTSTQHNETLSYPSFVDALRDLDDALTLVHLFAALPAEGRYGIPPDAVQRCRRLALEWQAYCARTASLRRAFVSVKGFYYQADVHGQSVTWLVPHGLAQVLPPDVDYRVMLTFLDFYSTLLRFVLFKLYHSLGLRYPPVVDAALAARAAELAAIMAEMAGLQADRSALQSAAAAKAGGGQQQQQQDGGGGGGGDGGSAPDVVKRLATLGDKLRELQGGANGGSGGAAEEDDEADGGSGSGDDAELGIDSGSEEEEEDSEAGSEAGDDEDEGEEEGSGGSEEEEEEESAESEEEEGASDGDERQQRDADGAAAAPAAAEEEPKQQQQQQQQQQLVAVAPPASVAGGALGVSPDDDAAICAALLRGCVVFLAREVPREPLLFIIRAFGGTAAWDGEGSPYAEADDAITHQVVDRPVQGHRFLARAYVQPQWVVDSANARVLMPADLYAPGKAPPPHLSPFVDHEAEGYTPDFAHTVAQLQVRLGSWPFVRCLFRLFF